MADTNLSSLFKDSVQVTTKDLTCDLNPGEVDRNEKPSRILLGKLYCYTRLGRKAIFGSLNNAWISLTGWSWKEREDGLLQFTFQTSFDAENVLHRRSWLVCGYLLVLMPWPSWLTPAEVSFDQTPIWVRLKSIPLFYWNKTNLQELAGKVSAVYELPRLIEKNFERGSFGMGTLCFRATVDGAFFPMFGSWMDKEAVEKSPFHLPLVKWFNDWITQQEALKDPTANAKKTKTSAGGGGKQSGDMRSEGVVEKVIPEQPPEKMVTAHDTPTNTVTETMSTEEVRPEDGSVPLSHFGEANNKGEIPSIHTQCKKGNLPGYSKDSLGALNDPENELFLADTCELAVGDRENFHLNNNFKVGLFFNSLLGPQAQPLDWPSRACWARAFGPLTGSNTVDKFQIEPTLFNPILDIKDFKCQEIEQGPRKRKAIDGFYMVPGVLPSHEEASTSVIASRANSSSKESLVVKDDHAAFSPGSNEGKPPKRKRGRPRKFTESSVTSVPSPSSRGRSGQSKVWTGVNSKSLKKKGETINAF
ncbi:hypothetical protein F8388_001359 [Cannabis sativa]|uniref:DUF4283 domain-containing protein n=1 Tax=Cannabis sativa TaxID=3483 RepID=A0A7J6GMK9_CANSA|nr:hypothetical protein F8388_001359 [Cannabis sativa]